MAVRVLVLLCLLSLGTVAMELPAELQELIKKQNAKMAKYNELKASLQPDKDGLVHKNEYGQLIKAVLVPNGNDGHSSTRTMVDDYVKTLPERMNPEKVLMDISSGAFSTLMSKKLEADLNAHHDNSL